MAPTTLTERSSGCGFSAPIQRKTERSSSAERSIPQHVGATLERGHQLVHPGQVGEMRLGEQPRGAVHVEGLASIAVELGEGRGEAGDEARLGRAELAVGEPAGHHPRSQRLCRRATRSGSSMPTRPARGRPSLSKLKARLVTAPVEVMTTTITRFGCSRSTSTRWIVAALHRRRRDQRHQVGHLGQHRSRLTHRLVHLAPQLRELELHAPAPAAGPTRAGYPHSGDSRRRSGSGRPRCGGGSGIRPASSAASSARTGRWPPLDPGLSAIAFEPTGLPGLQVGIDHQAAESAPGARTRTSVEIVGTRRVTWR